LTCKKSDFPREIQKVMVFMRDWGVTFRLVFEFGWLSVGFEGFIQHSPEAFFAAESW
jgi:predicted ABC-type exoprotein transport system permease subunit